MSINAKLNLAAIIYTLGAFLYQPVATVVQLGMLVYLSIKREWKYFIYGAILFICLAIISYGVYEHKLKGHDNFYLIALALAVFANLFWFAATIKHLKRIQFLAEFAE